MNTDFLLEYIPFLYSRNTKVTPKQMTLIASGKRTPSNLFTAEKNDLQGLFNSGILLDEAEWKNNLDLLVKKQILVDDLGVYKISQLGLKRKKEFIVNYPFFTEIKALTFSLTRKEFWKWFVFVNQILSEHSYRNSRYIPFISETGRQIKIKKWLAEEFIRTDELTTKWANELMVFIEELPEIYRHFLLDHLMGHESEGLTKRQLSQKYHLGVIDIDIMITYIMQKVYEKGEELPLFNSLWDAVHAFCREGLSESAWRSRQLLDQNYSIEQVARMRKLKENTIKEHVLENVLIDPQKSLFKDYVPKIVYTKLNELFDTNENLTYKEAKNHFEVIDFFWFRLIEIERIRVITCQQS